MASSKENKPKRYLYYDFLQGNIAREEVGNEECASTRFKFYKNGEWVNDWNRSLHLCDATMAFGESSVWDYEELTEEEAMRRISEYEKK